MSAESPDLIPGRVDPAHFEIMVQFTSMSSGPLIAALRSHFVEGLSQKEAHELHGVNQGLLSRRVKILREINLKLLEASKFYFQQQDLVAEMNKLNLSMSRLVGKLPETKNKPPEA